MAGEDNTLITIGVVALALLGAVVVYKIFTNDDSLSGAAKDAKGSIKGTYKDLKGDLKGKANS